jgi:hypothetical protein
MPAANGNAEAPVKVYFVAFTLAASLYAWHV